MKAFTKEKSATGVLLLALVLITAVTLIQVSASAGIFGMGEYPGGKLKAVFLISEPNSEAPEREYTIEIEPQGDSYEVTEKVISPNRDKGDVSTAFGASGGASAGGSQYSEDGSVSMDLSPLSTIDDRNIEIKPNDRILLPDGGRLVTEDVDTIAGLEVVMGTFTHSNYPDQRARFGFADREARDLLLFPAFFELIEDGEVDSRIELVEYSYQS
ncbi:hypothetical protein KGY71_01875 [Candidatus Bipolaricaulota bacterium]|nr:hypothetical protein [Candidatus Bipolaricaulota bacterium]